MDRKLTGAEMNFVESKLYSYPQYRQVLAEYDERKIEMIESSRGPDDVPTKGNLPGRPTEHKAVQLLLLEQTVARESFWCRAIEDTLKVLDEEQKQIVQLKYFEGYLTNEGIMMRLHIDKNRFYRVRRELLTKFARRFAIF